MRRTVLISAMLIILTILLSGCSSHKDDSAETPPAEGDQPAIPISQAELEPTPLPTVTPTPVPIVAPSAYEFERDFNNGLNMGFKYPSHWISMPGQSTVCYIEPVNEGDAPARFALSGKKVKKKPNSEAMAGYIDSFTEIIAKQYVDFDAEKLSRNIKFTKRSAYSRTYTGTQNGVPMKGFIICTCDTGTKIVYVLHFSAPAEKYNALNDVMKTLVNGVITL